MQMIEVSKLKPHPRNTEFFDDITGDKWEDFKKSIIRRGVVEGVVITQDLLIVSGHQRVRACKELGIVEIPCRITHYPKSDERTGNTKEDMVLEDLISTNILQRGIGNVNPMKMARCIVELERIYGIRQGSASDGSNQYTKSADGNNFAQQKTQESLSKQIGIDQRQLQNYKKLNTLIPELQELIETGQLKATTGYKIWAKMSQEEQEKFLNEIGIEKVGNLTQKETDILIKEKQQLEKEKEKLALELKNRPTIEKEKIIETEVYPKDYHQIKNDLELLKCKLKEQDKQNIKPKKDRDIIDEFQEDYKFRINDFKSAINNFSISINPFIFMDNYYKKMDQKHRDFLLKEVSQLEDDIKNLKNQIKYQGGIVNE